MIILDGKDIERLIRRKPRPKRVKGVKPPAVAERELRQDLHRLWDLIIRPASVQIEEMIRQGTSPAELADYMDGLLRRAQLEYEMNADQVLYRWQLSVDKLTRLHMKSALARSFGIDVKAFLDNPEIADALKLGSREAADLIVTIPRDYLGDVADAVLKNFRGERLPEGRSLLQQIQEIGDVSWKRAKLIARDQTNKMTAVLDSTRQQSIGIEFYRWRTDRDQRVVGNPSGRYPDWNDKHHNHFVMEGLYCKWSDSLVISEDGKNWKKRTAEMPKTIPGAEIQCLPNDSKINFSNGLNKLYRRRYSGKTIELVLTDDIVFAATPNHPIMTDRGLVPIQFINKGDNIVTKMHEAANIGEINDHRFIPTFEQIFHSLTSCGVGSMVMPGRSSQFHGDGTNAEIDIIDFDSFLINKRYSESIEKTTKLGLSGSDMVLCHAFFSSQSGFQSDISGLHYSDCGRMSRLNLLLSLFRRHLSPFDLFCFALSSDMDSARNQMSPNDVSSDTEMFRNSIFAFAILVHGYDFIDFQINSIPRRASLPESSIKTPPFQMLGDGPGTKPDNGRNFIDGFARFVKFDAVLDRFEREYDGHVFNLQSRDGLYIADSVLVGNCRCYAEPVIDIQKIVQFAQAA